MYIVRHLLYILYVITFTLTSESAQTQNKVYNVVVAELGAPGLMGNKVPYYSFTMNDCVPSDDQPIQKTSANKCSRSANCIIGTSYREKAQIKVICPASATGTCKKRSEFTTEQFSKDCTPVLNTAGNVDATFLKFDVNSTNDPCLQALNTFNFLAFQISKDGSIDSMPPYKYQKQPKPSTSGTVETLTADRYDVISIERNSSGKIVEIKNNQKSHLFSYNSQGHCRLVDPKSSGTSNTGGR